MINRYDYSEEKADTEIDRILEEFMVEKSPAVVVEDDISVVEKIGQKYEL